jgi:hypothetical protein
MPTAPILCIGALWEASNVFWDSAPANGRLLGVKAKALRGSPVNFCEQSGIYVLYADFTPIYVGQVNKRLYARLKEHHNKDDLRGRWNRFTWFGLRREIGGNKLSVPGVNFSISTKQLLNHLEAIMIHSFEPLLNGQDGRFGKVVTRYAQVRDERLGPSDRDLLELVVTNGKFLPPNTKITARGWKVE